MPGQSRQSRPTSRPGVGVEMGWASWLASWLAGSCPHRGPPGPTDHGEPQVGTAVIVCHAWASLVPDSNYYSRPTIYHSYALISTEPNENRGQGWGQGTKGPAVIRSACLISIKIQPQPKQTVMVGSIHLMLIFQAYRRPPPSNPTTQRYPPPSYLSKAVESGDLQARVLPYAETDSGQAYALQQSKLIPLHKDDGA